MLVKEEELPVNVGDAGLIADPLFTVGVTVAAQKGLVGWNILC